MHWLIRFCFPEIIIVLFVADEITLFFYKWAGKAHIHNVQFRSVYVFDTFMQLLLLFIYNATFQKSDFIFLATLLKSSFASF